MNDSFGNATGVGSQAALEHYDQAVDAFLHAWPGVPESLQSAIAEVPDFALAHALDALVRQARGQGVQAREAAARARHGAGSALPRVRGHVALVSAIVEGRHREALAGVVDHLRAHPTDAVCASTALGAYGLWAFSGRPDHDAARLAFTEALAPHFPEPFPWLATYRGWARIEVGQVDEGLAMALDAIARRPNNGHNAHVVLHGLFEAGEHEACLRFVDAWLPGYPPHALMWGHLNWHAALAEIELGRIDDARDRLVGPIVAYLARGTPFMGLADIASLLWRLGLLGVGGLPWATAREHAQRHFPDGSNVFGELHLAMLAAAQPDRDGVVAVRDRLQAMGEAGHAGAPVAARWAEALVALIDGDDAGAKRHLDACRDGAVRLGGSHAQRGVVEQTAAALRLPVTG